MRNLKKLLALVLALVMSLALVTVASAKSASDFSDGADITYTEAVDVMTAIGVFDGVGNNTFAPNTIVTREQAAKIATYMLMGKEKADRLTTTVAPYADVAADRWSAGAIAYCTNEGILSGMGGGKFDPAGQLTGLQFAKIMLTALGYDAKQEGLVGSAWAINAAKLAITAGLDDGLEDLALSAAMTREQAAQMAFNTLKADTVDYNGGVDVSVGDLDVSVNKTLYNPTNKTTDDYRVNNTTNDNIVQFADEHFPKLKLNTGTSDDFGRPADKWTYDGDDVTTAVDDSPVVTYTGKVSDTDIAKDLKGYTVPGQTGLPSSAADTTFGMNDKPAATSQSLGAIVAKNGAGAVTLGTTNGTKSVAQFIEDLTGDGTLVEIYATDKVITKIVVVNYVVDKIDTVSTARDGDYSKTTYSISGASVVGGSGKALGVTYTNPDTDDTVVLHGDVAKGDIVTYVYLTGKGVSHVYPTTKVVGTQTAKNTGKHTITVGGTTYTIGTGVGYKQAATTAHVGQSAPTFPNGDKDANYYIDQYGFVVESDAIESTDYAVIDAIMWSKTSGQLDENGHAIARLIFADGTTKEVTVDTIDGVGVTEAGTDGSYTKDTTAQVADSSKMTTDGGGENNATWYGHIVTYMINSDGSYDLTVKTARATDIKSVEGGTSGGSGAATPVVTKGIPALHTTVGKIGDDDTIYVVKTAKAGSATEFEYNAYTGFRNVPTIELPDGSAPAKTSTVSFVAPATGAADFFFIDASQANKGSATDDDVLFIFDNTDYSVSGSGADAVNVFSDVVLNGELTDVSVKSGAGALAAINAKGLYVVTLDDKGVVTKATAVSDTSGTWKTVTLTADAAGGIVGDSNNWTYDGSETVYMIDGDTVYKSEATSALTGDTIYVKLVGTTGADAHKIDTMYIVKGGVS